MRKLSISLIVVVIASIIGLGWLLNQIYSSTQANPLGDSNPSLGYAADILSVVIAAENQSRFIENWNANSQYQLSIIPIGNFPVPESLRASFLQGEPLLLESQTGLTAHYVLPGAEHLLAIVLPVVEVAEENQLQITLTLSFYAGVIIIILIWNWPLIHRLITLRDTAKLLGKGDLSSRVKLSRFSYIHDIEFEFNRMADRIQTLIDDNKLLSRAVSHDLKTPLARLRFGLEAIADTDDRAQREKYSQRVNRDMEEMESLIETLLQYARLDENRVQTLVAPIELDSFIVAAIESNEDESIAINFHCEEGETTIQADKRYLTLLINNLLSNALRYARSQVGVTLVRTGERLVLTFEDDGEGIPKQEREHVVKPFWRGKTGDSKKGHGMGLAIVSRIAQWHGAELSIDTSEKLGGARVSLSFGKEK